MQAPKFRHGDLRAFECLRTADRLSRAIVGHPNRTDLISIPIFKELVFANCPEVMRPFFECDLHDTIFMSEDRFMAVAKVETPDFDIFVRRTGYDEFRIV